MQKMSLIVILFSRVGKINKDMLWGWAEVLRIVMSFVIIAYVPRLKQFEIHWVIEFQTLLPKIRLEFVHIRLLVKLYGLRVFSCCQFRKPLEDNSFLMHITIYVTFNIDQCIFITMPNVKKHSILLVKETREN